jgi:putative DNA primase/helicase
MDASKIVAALGGRWHGSYGMAPCPAHDDHEPSLSISQTSEGRILWHCHAGCGQRAVEEALRARGLLKDDAPTLKTRKSNRRSDKTYDYRDANGELLYQVVRCHPKSFSQRRPDGKGGWIRNLKGQQRVLYRLPNVSKSDANPVFIVEGEKDADCLAELGLNATCNPGGAGKWRDHYNQYLQGKSVIILPDNDAPGLEHARNVAASLEGIADQIKIVELPGLKTKGDASDWVANGGTLPELLHICDAAPVFKATSGACYSEAATGDRARGLEKPRTGGGEEPGIADTDPFVFKPSAPYDTARAFLKERYTQDGLATLYHFDGAYYWWNGRCYEKADAKTIRAEIYQFLDNAFRWDFRLNKLMPFNPTTKKVNDVVDALQAVVNLPNSTPVPGWLTDEHIPDMTHPPEELVALSNGLLHLPTLELQPPTPRFFSFNALDYSYRPDAGACPPHWIEFLTQLWPNDQESIDTLQEIFGYLLTADTSQQKIFMIVGPKRSGKGTIARVLTEMLGRSNVSAPTLASLAERFGLAPLIDKQAAIIADARLGVRADQAAIGERLLSISGEDSITVDRKPIGARTGRLPTRFLLLTNELPRFADASGALAGRLILLALTESFYGKEDLGLIDRLLAELPGILNWSIEGWKRLRKRGHFKQPKSSRDLMQELEDIASPIKAFIRDCCDVDPYVETACDLLYETWRIWCGGQGRNPTAQPTFGRDLRAAIPSLKVVQHNTDVKKGQRFYKGIAHR